VANGTAGRLEFYFGDGLGFFSEPQFYDLMAGEDITYILAVLDLDRDGNADFVSGGVDDGDVILLYNNDDDEPVIVVEMFATGYSDLSVKVTNPADQIVSRYLQTVPGADYWRLDFDGDGIIDGQTIDYNVQYGLYCVEVSSDNAIPGVTQATVGIGVNGSQEAWIFKDYTPTAKGTWDGSPIELCYTVEPVSSIQPPNGIPQSDNQPTFDWSGQVGGLFRDVTYHFQLDRYHDFRSPIYEVEGLSSPQYTPTSPLGADSIFYWRYRTLDGVYSEFSPAFAAYILGTCCLPPGTGDLDQSQEASPFHVSGIDLSILIDGLFIGLDWSAVCLDEADVDFGCDRPCEDEFSIDGIDLSVLIDALFISLTPPPLCDGTPD